MAKESVTSGRHHKKWSAEETEYLREAWGNVCMATMSKNLGRTPDSIRIRAQRLGLGAFLDSGDYITLNQLVHIVTFGDSCNGSNLEAWVNHRGLPVKNKLVENKRYRVVDIRDFWAWAEDNRSYLDFSRMEPLSLGAEPEWVADQRRLDCIRNRDIRRDKWTADDDSRLIRYLKQHRYGYAEISRLMKRTEGAIQRRAWNLGIRERPVRADSHGIYAGWSVEQLNRVADGITKGMSLTAISRMVGKSEKAVRGKLYYTYLSEDPDKVRKLLAGREWGYGAPQPTVAQGLSLSRTRSGTKRDLARLIGALTHRKDTLKEQNSTFFQRALCANWDDIRQECMPGCQDCDSCTEFIRRQK